MIELSAQLSALPCAEEMSPDDLQQYSEHLASKLASFNNEIHAASNNLELGLCLKDSDMVDQSFVQFEQISESSSYDIRTYESAMLRARQIYEPLIWKRFCDTDPDMEEAWQAYQYMGQLMLDVCDAPWVTVQRQGVLPELLIHGAVLRADKIPHLIYPSTSRENGVDGANKENHNLTTLGFNRKKEAWYKAAGIKIVLNNSSNTRRARGINVIAVAPLIENLCQDFSGPNLWHIEDIDDRVERRVAFCEFIAGLMIRECQDQKLRPFEYGILNQFSTEVRGRISIYRKKWREYVTTPNSPNPTRHPASEATSPRQEQTSS